jgi:hypothetical protein
MNRALRINIASPKHYKQYGKGVHVRFLLDVSAIKWFEY